MRNAFVGVGLLSVFASASYAWDEPARGMDDRSELMDAIVFVAQIG